MSDEGTSIKQIKIKGTAFLDSFALYIIFRMAFTKSRTTSIRFSRTFTTPNNKRSNASTNATHVSKRYPTIWVYKKLLSRYLNINSFFCVVYMLDTIDEGRCTIADFSNKVRIRCLAHGFICEIVQKYHANYL